MGSINGTNGHAEPTSDIDAFSAQEFDFVIVGGGTAGLMLAARLTENPDVTVGVLEAGKNRLGDPLVDTPAAFIHMLGNPEYDWNYRTVPQEGNKDIVHHMPRGKVLGGSSAINYMMYVRGSLQDYDDWADLVEDSSWNASTMAQYMRKHQTLEPVDELTHHRPTMGFVGEHHGTSGPVRTSFNDWRLEIEDDVIKGADEVTGLSKKPTDPWSGDHIGFFNTLGAVIRTGPNKGKRSYAARGCYEANMGRPNLHVLCEALVTKIELEDAAATGVHFRFEATEHFVKVRREVLVCGGTIESPKILELSGIGNPDILTRTGIKCKIELPGVGENFQDHTATAGSYYAADNVPTLDAVSNPDVMAAAQKQLMESGGGPLTCISSTQGFFPWSLFASKEEVETTIKSIEDIKDQTVFEKRSREKVIAHLRDPKSANLQFILLGITIDAVSGVGDQSKLFPPHDGKSPMSMAFAVCGQYMVSRGSVHITSSDPSVPPKIDPAYLKHEADVSIMAAGMKFIDKLAKSKALEGKVVSRFQPDPECDLQDTTMAKQAVRDFCLGEYHPCGTCAMGDVLDSKLKVKGVKGLRVVDASVFPNHVSGNIVSSVYAVAEKAADMIKEEWDHGALDKTGKA